VAVLRRDAGRDNPVRRRGDPRRRSDGAGAGPSAAGGSS
jgi:hypothetical protein